MKNTIKSTRNAFLTKFFVLSLGLSIASVSPLGSQSAQAATKTWNGGTVGNLQTWNTATNWSGNANPVNGDILQINVTTGGNFPIITSVNATAFNPGDVSIGTASGNTGRLDIRSGTLVQNVIGTAGNWFFVGGNTANAAGGTGTLNIADTSGSGGTLTGFAQGSSGLTIGKLWVGGRDNNIGTGTVNINTSGIIDAQSTGTIATGYAASVIIGSNAGSTGTLKLDSGTINSASQIAIGYNGATGTFNMSGGTVNAKGVSMGRSAGTATLTISGGIFNNTTGAFLIGDSTAGGSTGAGTVNVNSGGTLNSSTSISIGNGGNGASSTAAGTMTVAGTVKSTGGGLTIGGFDSVKGTLNVNSGADIQLQNNTSVSFSTQASNTITGVVNQNGGAVTFYSDAGSTVGGTGVIDLKAAGVAGSSSTYNLNGGTLTVNQVKATSNVGTKLFNFNGGTLKAASANTTFVGTNGGRINVRDNGAVIDTNGFNVTIAEALLKSNVSGDAGTGGLTKNGTGTLSLAGGNTYSGGTTVNTGVLSITGGFISSSSLTIASGATLTTSVNNSLSGGSGTAPTGAWTIAGTLTGTNNAQTISTNVTLNNGTMSGNTFAGFGTFLASSNGTLTANGASNTISAGNFGLSATETFNTALVTDALSISSVLGATSALNGAIVKTGSGTVTLSGSSTYTGTTTVSAGTLSANNIVVSAGSSNLGNATSAVVLGDATNKGTLSYTGNSATYTRGFTVSAGGGEIDTTTSGQTLIIGTGNINNSSNSIVTLGGAGNTTVNSVIGGGSGGLTKTGAGTATLTNTNTYTGNTTISAGTLIVSGSISGSSVTVNSGGTLGGGGSVKDITLNAGGALTPGNSIGTLSTATTNGNVIWNGETSGSFAQAKFELSTIANTSDSLALGSGMLDKGSGSIFTFDFQNGGFWDGMNTTTYTLAGFGSTDFIAADFSYTNLANGLEGSFVINSGSLQFEVVPEPSTWAMLLGGLGTLVAFQHRRRHA